MISVLVGQPVIVRSNCAVAAVIFPVVSFVVLSVNTPLPEHDASASAIAGTSLDDLRSALKTNFVCGVGDGESVGVGEAATGAPPQAARSSAVAARPANRRIDTSLACTSNTPGRRRRMQKGTETGRKPDSVTTVISLGRKLPSASSDLPGDGAGHAIAPLRDLAARRACPFHPACAGSSLWR